MAVTVLALQALAVIAAEPARAATVVPTVAGTAATTYQTNGIAWAVGYANGVVYVGGTFTSVRPAGSAAGSNEVTRNNLAAFDASSGALLPCAPSVTAGGGTATVRALTASADGSTLYVGGYFSSIGGTGRSNLAAINTASCTLTPAFAPAVNATVRAVAVNAGSDVYFGGDFHTVNGQTRNLVAAVTTTGAVTAFNPDAAAPANDPRFTSMRALTVVADNSAVVLGGDFDYLKGAFVHRLAMVDPVTGAVTRTFGTFIDTSSAVKALTHDANNFYLGAEGTGGGVFDGRAAINSTTGAVVWRDNCLGATQALLVSGGTLYSASHAHNCSTTPGGYPDGSRHHLLAQATSDATIQHWFPNTNDGIGENLGPRALAMSPDGALWVTGEFTTVNNVAQQGVTRFPPRPVRNVPYAPVPSLASYKAGQVLVRWKTVADLDDAALTYRVYRDNVIVATLSAESAFYNRPNLVFADSVTPGSTHSYKLDVSDANDTSIPGGVRSIAAATTSSAYFSAVTADHPTTVWRMDDPSGTYAADSTGSDAGLIPTSGVTFSQAGATSDGNLAMTLSGAQASFQGNNRQQGPTSYSTELWFKTTTGAGGLLIGFGDSSRTNNGTGRSGNYDRNVYMTNAGRLIMGTYVNGFRTITSLASYNNGQWHHVVATLGGAGMALYVDGALVGANANTAAQSYAGYWHVGSDNLNSWPSRPTSQGFAGTIDDVSIYPIQLSAAQVKNHFTAR
ncbi:MAG: LamG domain-containing protein [Pseudonocardiales bacterium]